MKPSLSRPSRRNSRLALASTALLIAGAPRRSHARNLRRGGRNGSSDHYIDVSVGIEAISSNDYRLTEGGREQGFDVLGDPFQHEPIAIVADDSDEHHWQRPRSRLHEERMEEDPPPKEYINDETLAFLEPDEHSQRERVETSCSSDEKLWFLKFRTDRYGYETSWSLEQRTEATGEWKTISSGPPGQTKYMDNTVYQGATCLPGDRMYRLTIYDAQKDGLCCAFGSGYFTYSVGGVKQYDSNKESTFEDESQHNFYVGLPTNDENNNGNGPFSSKATNSRCGQNKQEITIKIWTDKYGEENSWELYSYSTNQVVRKKGLKSYGANDKDDVSICVPYGKYRFRMTDGIGDGICCGTQGDGRYEIYLDGDLILYGSDFTFGKSVSHDIIAGYHLRYDEMTEREAQYLDCHNWRRKKYHEQFGSEYVKLRYDMSLARDAEKWANELLKNCHVNGIDHEQGITQGENLAKNAGGGKWGQLYPVENICRRWFEREETWPYPSNAHFTQGLWRSARYLGCHESQKEMENGGMCRIQVCRYARAGNCNMSKYQASEGDNWKTPMLMDHNPCGPPCPPNGCHGGHS